MADVTLPFEEIQSTGIVLKGIRTLAELLGEEPTVTLSPAAKERWDGLVSQRNHFYTLPLAERLRLSGLSGQPGVDEAREMVRDREMSWQIASPGVYNVRCSCGWSKLTSAAAPETSIATTFDDHGCEGE